MPRWLWYSQKTGILGNVGSRIFFFFQRLHGCLCVCVCVVCVSVCVFV